MSKSFIYIRNKRCRTVPCIRPLFTDLQSEYYLSTTMMLILNFILIKTLETEINLFSIFQLEDLSNDFPIMLIFDVHTASEAK